MSTKEKKRLEEAEKVFNSIFKVPFPPLLKEMYVRAGEELSNSYSPSEIDDCQKAIERISDLEALELASRYLKKLPFLVLKFRIMVFLAEGWPLARKSFVNDKDTSFAGWFFIFYSGIRTVAKLIKGVILLTYLKI
jgi:hypothetical protein